MSFNPCVPSPCQNDGQCIRAGKNHQKHMCKCTDRWSGEYCDVSISPCELAKQKLSLAYLGDLFVTPIHNTDSGGNESASHASSTHFDVCKNGGICVDRMKEFKFSCECASGWKGELCDVADVSLIDSNSPSFALWIARNCQTTVIICVNFTTPPNAITRDRQ